MTTVVVLAVVTIAIALIFDYTNGFHDAANVVATIVASNAMTPRQAVVVIGVFELLGPIVAGTAVADTIGGVVRLEDRDPTSAVLLVLCGMLGAIGWNVVTWWRGLPSSSSHALVGGLAGVVLLAAGRDHVVWGMAELVHEGRVVGVLKILLSLVISPLAGFGVAFLVHRFMRRVLVHRTPRLRLWLRMGQWVASAALAFSHGANDAQKSMGIIALVLLLGGFTPVFHVPFWVVLACACAMTLGILSGGWRIVRTLGYSIYRLRLLHALDAQIASAGVIFTAALAGAPVSTTHVVSSAITGIGTAERPRAVRWLKARDIAVAWVITIPGSAAMAIAWYGAAQLLRSLAGGG